MQTEEKQIVKTANGETKYPAERIQSKDKETRYRTERQRVSFGQGEEKAVSVRKKLS